MDVFTYDDECDVVYSKYYIYIYIYIFHIFGLGYM